MPVGLGARHIFKTCTASIATFTSAPGNNPNQNIPAMHAPMANRIGIEMEISERSPDFFAPVNRAYHAKVVIERNHHTH